DPHLPPKRFPVKQQRRARIVVEIAALCALFVGVEDEAARPMSLEQHHARAGIARPIRRRQGHRLGIVELAGARLGKPAVEQRKWIGRHVGARSRLGSAETATHLVRKASLRHGRRMALDLYQRLGLKRGASEAEIKKAYRSL